METTISSLNDKFFQFIKKNATEDPVKLKLKYNDHNLDFPLDFALLQISLRSKTRNKFKFFLSHEKFLFPNGLSSEQASDELVAKYNASVAGTGKSIIDMTAGLGIDSMSMALNNNFITSIEKDRTKCEILNHNFNQIELGNNFNIICNDSIEYLKCLNNSLEKKNFDVLYIDPARRDRNNNRTYSFRDCEPDIISNQNLLQSFAHKILIKASPMLDVSLILNQLNDIKQIHLVSAKGECKEILVEIENDGEFKGLKVIDIDRDGHYNILDFSSEELHNTHAPIIKNDELEESVYLYEPDPGLMKVTAYGALCEKFPSLKRVAPNTSLYISKKLHERFPGRTLQVEKILDKKELAKLRGEKLNVTVRNYPVQAKDLVKKLKTKDGSDRFLYAFRAYTSSTPIMILAKKV